VLVLALTTAGCGSSKSKTSTSGSAGTAAAPTTFALSISEAGNAAKFAGPASVKGGLVTVQLTNTGKSLHGAQLIRILNNHTIVEAVKSIASESHKVPNWLRAEGGVGAAAPGTSASATVSLPAGSYAVVDFAGAQEGHGGPPAVAPLAVTPGQGGILPTTGTTITAAAPSKDHYKWEISGPLKVGANAVTFVSKGRSTLHELGAVRITGNESTAQLVKALESHGPPPSYVDPQARDQTAVLDGEGKALTTQLTLSKPGTYVFFCHLSDRNGGKPHFAEGLITTVKVQ
jgi:hypothetical protein